MRKRSLKMSMHETPLYSPFQRSVRLLAFVLFTLFSLYYLVLLAKDFQLSYVGFLFLAFLFAILSVDFLSGLLHWAADTWGTVDWPIVGKSIIQSFRLHHTDQKGITRHDFVETNGDVAIVAVLVQALGLVLLPFFAFHYFFLAYFGFLTIIGQMTNQFHKWAHQDRVPRGIRFLQKCHIILSSQHHETHHTAPHQNYYCITFGWLNPFLTAISFFPFLEKIVTFTTGLKPRLDVSVEKRRVRKSLRLVSKA